MQYRLKDSLGTADAKICNGLGAALQIDPKTLARGEVIELPKAAAEWLAGRYRALLEPIAMKAVAKKPEITAPAAEKK